MRILRECYAHNFKRLATSFPSEQPGRFGRGLTALFHFPAITVLLDTDLLHVDVTEERISWKPVFYGE
jgi:hypothetical protein